MSTPSPTPAERFATFVRWVIHSVSAMSGGDRLSHYLIGLITMRLNEIRLRVTRLAARIQAGTYAPRRSGPRRSPAVRRPRTPSKLPTTYGWLLPLVPEAMAHRSQFQGLLGAPEMAALLAAAPASLARPVRSLCWMLRLEPPPVLATPARPRPPRKPRQAAKTPPPAPPRPQPPAWMPRHRPWSLTRIRGSPRSG